MPVRETWWFPCQITRVVDGDTLDARLDLGHRTYLDRRIRLLGVNTPELNSSDPEERLRAQEAKSFVDSWVRMETTKHADQKWPFRVRSEKPDAFGRFLAHVECSDGINLVSLIVDGDYGTAVPQ